MVETQEWEAEVVDLKQKGLGTQEIAESLGKHPATIRRAVARARERGVLADDRVLSSDEAAETFSGPIEGQTTVDECDKCGQTAAVAYAPEYGANFCETCAADPQAGDPKNDLVNPREDQEDAGGTVSPDLLPDHDRDPLEDFRAEAGDAVGPMPPVTPPEPGETEHVLPVLAGTRQLALDLGPNAAPVNQATVVFKSEKWPSGFFGMGDVVTGTFTARVVSVPAKEAFDKASEEFRAKPVAYGALITEISYEAVDPGE